MRKYGFIKSAVALAAALTILMGSMPLALSAVAYFKVKSSESTRIGYGNAVSTEHSGSYDGKSGQLYSLEFTPSAALRPTLVTGGTNSERKTLSAMLGAYDGAEGVLGGINGGFYNAFGNAEGMQIQDGRLLSTNQYSKDAGATGPKFYTLGFKADGRALYGIPQFDLRGSIGNVTFSVNALNQTPYTSYGVWLLNSDYGTTAKWDTTYSANYYVLVFQKAAGEFAVGQRIEGTFSSYQTYTVSEAKKLKLKDGYFYLVGDKSVILPLAKEAEKGNTVSIDLAETTGLWQTAVTALRGGDLLIENGALRYDLDSAIMGTYTARSAVGIKQDGSIGLFTVNNNQKENGLAGLPLVNFAETVRRMGYVTLLNLDGGGSATQCVRPAASGKLVCVNDPSDGGQRAIANALALVGKNGTTTVLDGFESNLYTDTLALCTKPEQVRLGLSCGEWRYTKGTGQILLKAPVSVSAPAALSLWVKGGSGSLSAVFEGATGQMLQSVSLSGSEYREYSFSVPEGAERFLGFALTASKKGTLYMDQLHLHTLAENEDMISPTVSVKGTAVTAAKGTKLSMRVTDNDWGSGVDKESCVITAGKEQGSGTALTLQKAPAALTRVVYEGADKAGNRTRAYGLIAPKAYDATAFFADVAAGGWATDYINYCYLTGLLKGQAEGIYNGQSNMTRAEFCTTLVRLAKADPTKYKNVRLPYADNDDIPSWAVNYVKAAYELGFMSGSVSGGKRYFHPNAPITRGEAAVAAEDFLPVLSGFSTGTRFNDQDSIPAWCEASIERMSAYGVLKGDEKGNYRYNAPITRNEIAVVLTRLGG